LTGPPLLISEASQLGGIGFLPFPSERFRCCFLTVWSLLSWSNFR
jgi:hypothetical protein